MRPLSGKFTFRLSREDREILLAIAAREGLRGRAEAARWCVRKVGADLRRGEDE